MTDRPKAALPDKSANAAVRAELDSVRETMENATLKLGEHLRAIVKEADEFVTEIRSEVGSVSEGSEVGRVLGDQVHSVSSFVAEMGSVIGDQSDLTQKIYTISEEVIEAAMSVALVSRQSKMLSMNTMIEAARLGEEGRSFVVIAEEMRRLSENIAESNARIADLSRDLAPILESARANIEDLRAKADDFSAASDRHQAEIATVVDALANSTRRTLEAGDRRLADVLRISNAALVDLQFEDTVSQRLRKLAAGFGDGGDLDAPGFLSDALEVSEGGLAAGEIELF